MIYKFKIFEEFTKNKPIYNAKDLLPFIIWFSNFFEERMDEEGWFVCHVSGIDIPKEHQNKYYSNSTGSFWQIQRNDEANKLEDDLEAEKLAEKTGLMFDGYGIVIGFNSVSFLEHPEELEIYKETAKYNL